MACILKLKIVEGSREAQTTGEHRELFEVMKMFYSGYTNIAIHQSLSNCILKICPIL